MVPPDGGDWSPTNVKVVVVVLPAASRPVMV
jgi:hypothetical protein